MTVTRQALAVWLMIQARVEVMHHTQLTFEVLPKRWVVERTFGWINHYHRLKFTGLRQLGTSLLAPNAVV